MRRVAKRLRQNDRTVGRVRVKHLRASIDIEADIVLDQRCCFIFGFVGVVILVGLIESVKKLPVSALRLGAMNPYGKEGPKHPKKFDRHDGTRARCIVCNLDLLAGGMGHCTECDCSIHPRCIEQCEDCHQFFCPGCWPSLNPHLRIPLNDPNSIRGHSHCQMMRQRRGADRDDRPWMGLCENVCFRDQRCENCRKLTCYQCWGCTRGTRAATRCLWCKNCVHRAATRVNCTHSRFFGKHS